MAVEVHSVERTLLANVAWNRARVKLLARLLVALVRARTVNLAQLASVLESDALIESNYKRLQRFFRFFRMPYGELAVLIARLLGPERPWVLTLDRTEWHWASHRFNILVLAVAHRGAAVPVLFRVLPRIGTSSFADRKAILDEYLALFGEESVRYLTADREFHGRRFYQYLGEHSIRFCLRARLDTPVAEEGGKIKRMRSFVRGLRVGGRRRWKKQVWGLNLKVEAARLSRDEWLIVAASPDLKGDLFDAYRVRWEIETCLGCLKSRGFCLEATHLVHPERVKSLLAVLALCFCWAIRTGEWIARRRPLRLKSHGRLAKSMFRAGFDHLRRLLCNFDRPDRLMSWKDALRLLSCT